MAVSDRWHKSYPRPGDTKCKEHRMVPTAEHGKGLRWQVRWDVWNNGVREQPRRNFEYKSEAETFDKGLKVAPVMSVRQITSEWLPLQTFTDSSEVTTLSRIRNHITVDEFQDTLVFDLYADPNLIQLWLKGLRDKGLAPRTIRSIAGCLQVILEYARLKDVIPANPMRPMSPLIKLPRVPDKKVIPYTKQQLRDIIAYIPPIYEPIPRLGVDLGLRIGEIRGLSPDDIDGDVIHVRRQVKYNGKHRCTVFALPKGEKTRDIPLVPTVKKYLLSLSSMEVTLPWVSPAEGFRTVKVFAAIRGRPYAYETLLDVWENVHNQLGIERLPRESAFHRLRHTFASNVLREGADIRSLSEWLGHKRSSFTLDTYCHFIPSDVTALRRASDR